MPGIITFVHNWNNKLDCDAFTTIRLRNDSKFRIGFKYFIDLKENNHNTNKGLTRCADLRHFKIRDLNSFVTYLETGLNLKEGSELIARFYKNYNPPINWETQDLSLILLVKVKN